MTKVLTSKEKKHAHILLGLKIARIRFDSEFVEDYHTLESDITVNC